MAAVFEGVDGATETAGAAAGLSTVALLGLTVTTGAAGFAGALGLETAGAGLADGSEFSLFGRDCIVENGVCLLADRSALAGSAARMIQLVRTMVREVNVPLGEAVAMATENPARAIGLERKGRLVVGADADFVVLSPQLDVMQTFIGGERVWSN